jgi:hypothetical protein
MTDAATAISGIITNDMETEKKIRLDVFLCNIHVVVTESPNESVDRRKLRRYAEDEPGEDFMKNCDGFVFQKERSDYYVCLSPNVGFDVIAHESVHVIGRIFRDRGVEADYHNDELFAYHVGWIAGIMAVEVEKAFNTFSHEDDTKG